MSALVLEDRIDRKLRFMRIYFKIYDRGVKKIKQVQLGLMVNKSEINKDKQSPIAKWRSVIRKTD